MLLYDNNRINYKNLEEKIHREMKPVKKKTSRCGAQL